jgi:hypothetical protein
MKFSGLRNIGLKFHFMCGSVIVFIPSNLQVPAIFRSRIGAISTSQRYTEARLELSKRTLKIVRALQVAYNSRSIRRHCSTPSS